MLTVDQVIAVLEKALANPNYLAKRDENEDSTNWFCSSVHQTLKQNVSYDIADDQQLFICNTYIFPSITEHLFLKTHLIATGKIKYDTEYSDEEYKVAAHAHWQHLIDNLKQQVEFAATLYILGTPFEMKGTVSNITPD